MARKVIKEAVGPFEVKSQKESVWICICGMSKNQPFCDGAHKLCSGEEKGKLYEYDKNGHRKEIRE